MAVSDAHVFPGFLTPVLTQLSFQSHQLLFSHASAGWEVKIHPKESSPQPLGHESNTLTTEPFGWGCFAFECSKSFGCWICLHLHCARFCFLKHKLIPISLLILNQGYMPCRTNVEQSQSSTQDNFEMAAFWQNFSEFEMIHSVLLFG